MNLFSFNEITVSYSSKGLGPALQCSKDAYDLMLPNWTDIEYTESFYVILLNRRNNVLGVSKISVGSLTGTVVDPKKVFQIALKANAAGVILAHNHPSGNTLPSKSDSEITKKCVEAGKFLDMSVLDHIIATRAGYFSFADEGLL
jgi:DNA repair protein RadC